ncbi:geranylgeranylglyceryl/heptaprenylglyceryl phosphate synthase [Flavobacterium gelidilacus]|jgi:putative glycerol-1-phosphate prenyltransferase|uniref:geranylgeranylglyceryl/heptaprenylglyceryl phosphate synthase n=1 Tax=Flavobacterium gelidilacus TaxID=206041 RepID=UPI00041039E5|nr:geranylgeranylglyceryl/heptaprenylglyceryl phosphate synthase [Flavobacterium gelidilacus]
MKNIYQEILNSKNRNEKLLAILIDPDKVQLEQLDNLIVKINQSPATHIFVGGSFVETNQIDLIIQEIKLNCNLPILLFPGNPSQISAYADGVLFLNLISGRNPDYLIEHQVSAVPILEKTALEVISTGYVLIASGKETAVERISQTKPLNRNDIDYVCQTIKAGEYMGNKLIYLEAGSGAEKAIPLDMIKEVSKKLTIPLIVGGGIRSKIGIENAFKAGADLVVIGTAFENNANFFEE